MKVKDARTKVGSKKIGELSPGNTFIWAGALYVLADQEATFNLTSLTSLTSEARSTRARIGVILSNGVIDQFWDHQEIEPVSATAVIED